MQTTIANGKVKKRGEMLKCLTEEKKKTNVQEEKRLKSYRMEEEKMKKKI